MPDKSITVANRFVYLGLSLHTGCTHTAIPTASPTLSSSFTPTTMASVLSDTLGYASIGCWLGAQFP